MPIAKITSISRRHLVGFSLLVFVAILLINHIFGFFGHFGYDDIYYAALAQQVLAHTFTLATDHYCYRWVVVFLTALAYKTFGINDHASALMPVVFTVLTAYLVTACIRHKWQAALAVFLFGLYSWTLFYADKIMPDVYVAFFFFAAVYIVYAQTKAVKNVRLYGALFAASLMLGLLSKETILLTLPIFFYLFFVDMVQKRNTKFWGAAAVSGIMMLAFYFIIIRIEAGSFFQRFYALKNGSYFNPCSYDLLPISETIKRIGWGLWLVFIRSGLFFLITFSCVAISKRTIGDILKISTGDEFFPMVLILGLLCSNFMSTSVLHYVPMCDDPRHYLFLAPLAAVVASKGVLGFFEKPKSFLWVPVLFFIFFLLAKNQHFENPYLTYLPLCIITLVAVFAAFAGFNLTIVGVSAVIAVSFAQPVQSFLYARSMGYRFQKRLVKKDIIDSKNDAVVITDDTEKGYGNYYLGFDTAHIVFKSYDDIKKQPVPTGKKIYLLLDGFSLTTSGKRWEDLPAYAKHTGNYKLMGRNEGAELYEMQPEDLKR